MILFSIGLPSRFTEWCDRVTGTLANRALGPLHSAHVDTPDELAVDIIRTGAPHVLVCSRKPSARLLSALAETRSSFLLVLGDPRQAVADLMMNHGCDLNFAVKFVANSYASIVRFARLDGALVLDAAWRREGASEIVAAVAAHFRLEIPADEIAGLVESHPMPGEGDEEKTETWWHGLGPEGQGAVSGALAGYARFHESGVMGEFTWERGLFLIADTDNESATRAVDITGRPRCLLFGPYIALPPGAWLATIVVGFSKETAGSGFHIDLWAGTKLGETRIQSSGEQVQRTSLEFEIDDSRDNAIEIQVFNERAAFDGRIGLGRVIIAPRSKPAGESDSLLAELSLTS